jgi:hypothetical protein
VTQHHDPVHPEPGDLEPLPHLSDDDDHLVRGMLAELAPVTMPPDVVARIEQALAAERPPAAAAAAPTPGPATTVTPLAARRRWAPARLLQAAAAIVLVGGGLVVAVNAVGSDESGGAATALDGGRSGAAPEVQVDTVSASGQQYTQTGLTTQVADLLAGREASASPPAAAAALVRDEDRLASCLAALEMGLDDVVAPIAVDAGSYEAQPAVVVVLPALDAGRLDVFVVEPACSTADARLIVFRSIDRP